MNRRFTCLLLVLTVGFPVSAEDGNDDPVVAFTSVQVARQPNILFCISDDQSYAHTGFHGESQVRTPAFDRIAREGIYFSGAFCDAPTCGPSRSAILTGQSIWRLEQAGNIHSTLPAKFTTYTELLQKAG